MATQTAPDISQEEADFLSSLQSLQSSGESAPAIDPEEDKFLEDLRRVSQTDKLKEEILADEVAKSEGGLGTMIKQPLLAVGQGLGGIARTAGALIEDPITPGRVARSAAGLVGRAVGAPEEVVGRMQTFAEAGTPDIAGKAIAATRQVLPAVDEMRKQVGSGVREFGKRQETEFGEAREAVGGGPVSKIAGDFTNVLIQSAPALVAAAMGGPGGAAIVAGAQSMGQMQETAIDNLMERFPEMTREEAADKAAAPAALAGAVTAALTRFFPGGAERMTRNLARAIASKGITASTVKGGLQNVIKEVGLEIPEEMLDELSQGLVEKVSSNPDNPFEEILNQVIFAGAAAGVTTGVVGGGLTGIAKLFQSDPTEIRVGQPVNIPKSKAGNAFSGTITGIVQDPDTGRTIVKVDDGEGNVREYGDLNVRVATKPPPIPDETQTTDQTAVEQPVPETTTVQPPGQPGADQPQGGQANVPGVGVEPSPVVLTKTKGPTLFEGDPAVVPNSETTVQGITFSEPVAAKNKFVAKALISGLAELKKRFPALQISKVNYVRGGKNDPAIYTNPSAQGFDTINIDLKKAYDQVGRLNRKGLQKWVNAVLTQELFHNASGLAIYDDYVNQGGEDFMGQSFQEYYDQYHRDMYREMTPKQRERTMQAYGLTPDQEVEIAAEFVRMTWEKRASGITTEEVLGNQILNWFRGLVAQLRRMLESSVEGPAKNRLQQNLRAAEAILGTQEQLQGQLQTGAFQGGGRVLGARAITEEEVSAQFLNQTSPEQIYQARIDTFIQNDATVGFARAQFEPLPQEVKNHMPFVEQRLKVRDSMGQLLNIPETSNQSLEQQINSLPDEARIRETAIKDAWDNAHLLIEQQIRVQQKLTDAIDKLAADLANPEKSKSKKVKKSKVKLRQEIVSLWKDNQVALRQQALDAGQDVSVFDRNINLLNEMVKNKSTALSRMIDLMYTTRDPAAITQQALGLGDREFAFVKSIADFYGAERAERLVGEALSSEQKLVNELQDANDFLVNTVFGSDTWQANLEYMTKTLGLESRVVTDSDVAMTFEDPFDPEIKIEIPFSFERGADAESEAKLADLANRIQVFLETPGVNPIRKAAYERHLQNILNIYLNPHFKTGEIKLMTNELTMWNALWHAVANFNTAENRLIGIGGRAMQLSMFRLRNMSQAYNVIGRIHREHSTKVEYLAKQAADKHGLIPRMWIDEIANEVIASYQDIGGRRLKVGDKINGYTVTKEDMDAIQAQYAFTSAVSSELENLQTTQNRAFPLRIQDAGKNRIFPVNRLAGHTGPMTMPRRVDPKTQDYVRKWAEIERLVGENDAQTRAMRIQAMESFVRGERSEAFRDLVIGHMRSAAFSPSYFKFVKSPFTEHYRELISRWDNGDDTAPTNIDDVILYVTESHNAEAEAEEQMTIEDVKNQILLKEIGRMLKNINDVSIHERIQSDTTQKVDVIRSDNFLNQPRTEQILPDTLYKYTAASVGDQFQILHAVHEVYGQNYADSLYAVKATLENSIAGFKAQRDELIREEGLKERKATKKVKKESVEAQRVGDILFNWDEAIYHLRQINAALAFVSDMQSSRRDFFNEELRTGLHSFRRLLASGILNKADIVFRNRLGGTLRVIQSHMSMGFGMKVMGVNIPASNILVKPSLEIVKTGLAIVNWMTQSRYFASRYGDKAVKYLQRHEDFFGGYAGAMMNFVRQHAVLYDKARAFGLAGNSIWMHRVRNLWQMFSSGGRLRTDEVSTGRKVIRHLESTMGMAYELGLHNLTPANVLAHTADMEANFYGMKAADGIINKLKINAMSYMGLRQENGLLSVTTVLSPKELIGTRQADEKNAIYVRNLFNQAGINIDAKMQQYYLAVQAAKESGQDPDAVALLDDAEYNSFQMVMADETNRSSYANRPESITQSELGKNMMLFFGYPIWLLTKFAQARARLSNAQTNPIKAVKTDGPLAIGKVGFVRGNYEMFKYLFATILVGNAAEPVVRALVSALYDEVRETRELLKQADWKEGLSAMIENSGNFMPMIGGIYNMVVERAFKPGGGIGRQGINLVPFSVVNAGFTWIRDTISTGSGVRPTMRLLTQWMPNLKIGTNRLPINNGAVEYYNTNRGIRKAIPSGMEFNRGMFSGNIYQRSAYTDNKDNVINALLKTDGPDWPTVQRERLMGIATMRELGRADAVTAFDSSILAKTPMRSVLGRLPTLEERNKIIERMSDEDKERLKRVEAQFLNYASTVGRTLNLYEGAKAKPVLPSLPSSRGSNPFLGPRDRDRILGGGL